jgi:undecaprenyl diphosphate synthase
MSRVLPATRLPAHVALIGDGNRRWAEAHGLPAAEGHLASVPALRRLVDAWRERTASATATSRVHLTFWWSSIDNLRRRDAAELAVLFEAYRQFFDAFPAAALDVELRAYGRWRELLPPATAASVDSAIDRSARGAPHVLSFLLAYNGDEDLLQAIDALRRQPPSAAPTDDALLRAHLRTGDLPAVDLAIRTGGDAHFSNGFLMWQTQNAQLWFSDVLWPDFAASDLDAALAAFARARRRFGA